MFESVFVALAGSVQTSLLSLQNSGEELGSGSPEEVAD